MKIINWFRRLFKIKRKLKGEWTVGYSQDLRALYSMDSKDELIEIMSEELRRELESYVRGKND